MSANRVAAGGSLAGWCRSRCIARPYALQFPTRAKGAGIHRRSHQRSESRQFRAEAARKLPQVRLVEADNVEVIEGHDGSVTFKFKTAAKELDPEKGSLHAQRSGGAVEHVSTSQLQHHSTSRSGEEDPEPAGKEILGKPRAVHVDPRALDGSRKGAGSAGTLQAEAGHEQDVPASDASTTGTAHPDCTEDAPSIPREIPEPILTYKHDKGAARVSQPDSSHQKSSVLSASRKSRSSGLAKLDRRSSELLDRYRIACTRGDLQGALEAVEEARHSEANGALSRFKHKDFLRAAARLGMVSEAFRFVQLLPPEHTDGRTYNMLISVCAENKDLPGALKAAGILQSTGAKLDRLHYTNLIKAAATSANADQAFRLYSEMRKNGIQPCAMVIATLIDACTREMIQHYGMAKDRRTQLVLMERAFQVFADGISAKVVPDLPLWNALINAAGRAGQLDRAFQALDDMQARGLRPNDRTFSTVITACRLAGRRELAFKVYKKAKREGVTNSLMVYIAAMDACLVGDGTADLKAALDIYTDMQQNDVVGTAQFFASLINVAGHAGNLTLALSIQEDMSYEGIEMDDICRSALISACLRNGNLERAKLIYNEMRTDGNVHITSCYNAMINAYAEAARLGDTIQIVEDMNNAGVIPDKITCGALVKACQRAAQPDLAFEIYKVMSQQGILLDESMAFSLIRSVFNQLRSMWRPGGYPPVELGQEKDMSTDPSLGLAMLKALNASSRRQTKWEDRRPLTSQEWQKRAVAVYRESTSTGQGISMRLLDRVLACLRLPLPSHSSKIDAETNSQHVLGGAVLSMQAMELRAPPNSAWGIDNAMMPLGEAINQRDNPGSEKKKHREVEIVFDARAVALLEEAVAVGVVPQFELDSDDGCTIDMRSLLPSTAEVYVLAMFRSLERRGSPRFSYKGSIKLLVPPFNVGKIFCPSYMNYEQAIGFSDSDAASSVDDVCTDPEDCFVGMIGEAPGPTQTLETGLAVAAQLRRLKVFNNCVAHEGIITILPREVTRWVRTRIRDAVNANRNVIDNGMAGPMAISPGFPRKLQNNLAMQQRDIRTQGPF